VAEVQTAKGVPRGPIDMPYHEMQYGTPGGTMTKKKDMHKGEPTAETSMKMGRKPLDDELRRTRRISVVVNDAEFSAITSAAAAAGDPASIWGRKIMLKAAADTGHKK
jgi:hypothetical protein